MKKIIVVILGVLACSGSAFAQTTGVQFGPVAEREATIAKLTPLLASPALTEVETLCRQVAADGMEDALVRTKLFMLGQAVSCEGPSARYQPTLEALFAKYAQTSAAPVQQLFFLEQLRWIGSQRSLPVILELCRSQDVNLAASANMTRQAIEQKFDPPTVVYSKTKMRKLTEALEKADEAEAFRLLAAAVQSGGDLPYQAFALRKIGEKIAPQYLNQWCEVARRCEDPQLTALLIRTLGAYQETAVTGVLLDLCGHTDPAVAAAALAALARRDPQSLQEALPTRLANLTPENYKGFSAFLATLPAAVTVPALTAAYPAQEALGRRLILETLTAHPGSEPMVKAALDAATARASDPKLATAGFRYLRQWAGAGEQSRLLESISAMTGGLQAEAVQAYAMAARQPGNEIYGERLLQLLKEAGAAPSGALLEAAGRIGSPPLLAHVSALASTNKDALRALSTWRDGVAAPALMQALAQNPADAFLLRSVRQQLQATLADASALTQGWSALVACGQLPADDLREFAVMINRASNIALNRPVTATLRQEGERAPRFITDGDPGNESGFWSSGSPVEITVDLESVRTVAAAQLFFYADGGRYYQYRIDTSLDKTQWQPAIDRSSDTSISQPEGFRLAFDARPARYVKLTVTKNSANPSVHVNELMLFTSADTAVIDPAQIPAPPLKPDAEGFVTLFDGTDLDAWTGDKKAYTINDQREIAVKPLEGGSGYLYTLHDYDNFTLRFEFKLTPGANNGIGVRTPLNAGAAYSGFEIQVLDDTHPKYAELEPYQYHGSVYGIIPAKRGSLRPVGEWNTEEIVMDGRHVKVTVNGTVIVDADLDEASRNGTPDKKEHPGLKRTTGRICFCGHGDQLWFRNVKVKPIVR